MNHWQVICCNVNCFLWSWWWMAFPPKVAKHDERARDFIAIRKKVVNTMGIWSTSKMFSQLKLVNIPLYLKLVNATTAIFETTRNNGFSNKRRWTSRCISLRRDVCAMYLVARERWSSVRVKSCAYQVFGLSLGSVESWGFASLKFLNFPKKVEVRHINFEVEVMLV